jgi:alkyldihydroxyacetonephosphate synthase
MSAPAPRMRWWGWGEDGRSGSLPPAAAALLERELGSGSDSVTAHVPLERVELPAPRLADGPRAELVDALGSEHVRDDRLARVTHAAGKSYPDLVRMRSGEASGAPDVVAYPGSAEEVRRILAICSEARLACVPFGGGTSVVGGVEPKAAGLNGAVSLDLARLGRLREWDEHSLTATLEAGMTGPRAEEELARRGLTLGHFPQSFEYATVGGFVATRSAGQASTGHGRLDDLVLGLRLVSPAGDVVVRPGPASAAGPAIAELVMGSEGVLGVITEATLSVRRVPRTRRYEAWSFRDLEAGLEAFRALAQQGSGPDVARLSDREETRLSMALAGASGHGGVAAQLARRAGGAYLRARGHAGGCLAIIGFEGEPADVARRRSRSARVLRSGGGLPLGRRPGLAWLRGRYQGPYLRDALLDRGVMVETLETATRWADLSAVHRRVGEALRGALRARGTPPLVMCHVSHLYRSGASLYFTFMARQERGAELEQWRVAKQAAGDAIVAAGATITHHHAVGSDHAPWMRAEVGELGLELLRAAKDRLDPAGVMNPGKLLHDPPALALPGDAGGEDRS